MISQFTSLLTEDDLAMYCFLGMPPLQIQQKEEIANVTLHVMLRHKKHVIVNAE